MKITKRLGLALVMALVLLAWSGIARSGEIHDAAKAGNVAKVKSLLTENPDLVNAGDKDKWTPLHEAVFVKDNKDMVELLLANKADINAKDKNGWTPLHVAAYKGNKDMVKLL